MTTANFQLLKLTIQQILLKAAHYDWSLQGFGMLRLYMSKQTRLHLWSDQHKVSDVSDIHTHPWDFQSVVIAGELRNLRLYPERQGKPYLNQTILCGPGGYPLADISRINLWAKPLEIYKEGDTYKQSATEIHQSFPLDGTVTLIQRQFREDDDHAQVFWPPDKHWVSAEPRKATTEEVATITRNALERWF